MLGESAPAQDYIEKLDQVPGFRVWGLGCPLQDHGSDSSDSTASSVQFFVMQRLGFGAEAFCFSVLGCSWKL